MPDEISVVKIFAKMMNDDEELLVKFFRYYFEEIDRLNSTIALQQSLQDQQP